MGVLNSGASLPAIAKKDGRVSLVRRAYLQPQLSDGSDTKAATAQIKNSDQSESDGDPSELAALATEQRNHLG